MAKRRASSKKAGGKQTVKHMMSESQMTRMMRQADMTPMMQQKRMMKSTK